MSSKSMLSAVHDNSVQPLADAVLQREHTPPLTAAQPASQPSAGSLLVSKKLAGHSKAVQVVESEHALQEAPPVIEIAEQSKHDSQPFDSSPSESNLLAAQETVAQLPDL
jgi:hypothetical protein